MSPNTNEVEIYEKGSTGWQLRETLSEVSADTRRPQTTS